MTDTPTNAAKFTAWFAQALPQPRTVEDALRERSILPDAQPKHVEPGAADLPPVETQTSAEKFAAWADETSPQPRTVEEAMTLSERFLFSDPEPSTGVPSAAALMKQIAADSATTNTL